MPDESLLQLERSLRATPDDATLRLRLASTLARSGRRHDALTRLAVASFPDALFPAARKLADELWQDEVLGFDRVGAVHGAQDVSVPGVEPTGRLLAWISTAGRLSVADAVSGTLLLEREDAFVDDLKVARRRVFYHSQTGLGSLTLRDDGTLERHRADPAVLLDVSPEGDRVVLRNDRVEGVYAWPSLAPVIECPCRATSPIVDWDANLFLSRASIRRLSVFDLAEGKEVEPLDVPGDGRFHRLGRGTLAQTSPGIALIGVTKRFRLELVKSREAHSSPTLSSDGRGVRVLLAGVPVRFSVDLDAGTLRDPASHPPHLARQQRRPEEGLWHPHADMVFVRRAPFYELQSLGGTVLRKLPANSYPMGWTADGRMLVVNRSSGDGNKVWLELWRARDTRGS